MIKNKYIAYGIFALILIGIIFVIGYIQQINDSADNTKLDYYTGKDFSIGYLRGSNISIISTPIGGPDYETISILSPDYEWDNVAGNIVSGFSISIQKGTFSYENIDICKYNSSSFEPCLLAQSAGIDYTEGEIIKTSTAINGCSVIIYNFTSTSSRSTDNLLGFVTRPLGKGLCNPYTIKIMYNRNYENPELLTEILNSVKVSNK